MGEGNLAVGPRRVEGHNLEARADLVGEQFLLFKRFKKIRKGEQRHLRQFTLCKCEKFISEKFRLRKLQQILYL